ncbi:hypothetical protein O181_001908 [Austropuccinia psidii MF-1]|uniref:Vacuolar protein sorting-associated protein 16 homolog n=1 Tax=Austropuccinia psidii MF-1 TaxID=1389203 RepID=A0A9Q3BBR2_9BASI|nr:hypothetical protein [Austropuccinia psidii MF-1]
MSLNLPPNSADWDALGDAFYRKQEIYRMAWDVADLSSYRVVGAPFSGPVAITFDTSQPIPILGPSSSIPSATRPRIHIYSCSGQILHTVLWDHPSNLISFGFTNSETLVTLSSAGFYRLYPISGNQSASGDLPVYTQHTLGSTTEEIGILDAIIWSDGMIVMRSDLTFLQVKGWPESNLWEPNDTSEILQSSLTNIDSSFNESRALTSLLGSETHQVFTPDQNRGKRESLDSGGLTEKPTAWALIPPYCSSTGVIQILASRQDSIIVIDPMDSTDQRLSAKGPFQRIVPSPNGKFLALLTGPLSPKPHIVWVVSSDFSRELSEFSLEEHLGEDFINDGPPTQMVWCGGDTVAVGWEKSLVMIGPFGASLRYVFSETIHLISEIDGIRILSSNMCEFLSKVAPCTNLIFKPGSTSPAAILFDAMDHFDKRSARVADEHIRNIKKSLGEAVTVCIQAAAREIEPRWQERLMRAAAFGKAFLDMYNPEPFVKMSKTLRVLNAVRNYKVGIPLTYEQYIAHPPAHLISRLTARSHYLLALRLTEFLNLSPSSVLRHWSHSLILNMSTADPSKPGGTTPASITRKIISKLKDRHGVSPADIAEIAWSLGKTKICVELLSHELRPTKQIPLLMNMDQGNEALDQAIISLDPDLIQTVLWQIRTRKPLAEFLSIMEKKEEAINTLRVWAKSGLDHNLMHPKDLALQATRMGPDWELFRDFCYQDDRRTESACLCLEESYLISCPPITYSPVVIPDWETFFAAKLNKIQNTIQFFSEDSSRIFEQRMMNESIKLLNFQKLLIFDVLRSFESGPNLNDHIKKNFLNTITKNNGLTLPSLNETMRQCIKLGFRKQADKLKVDFKVSEKRFWYLKMKVLIELRDWDELENWSGKKSPIGFEPFVNHLLMMGYNREALKFIKKCEAKNRIELYIKCGEWLIAGNECADRGETTKLIELRQRCPNPILASALSKLIEGLAA